MSAEEPLAGPEGGLPAPLAPFLQSEGGQSPLPDAADTAEGGEQVGGPLEAGCGGGSWAGGHGAAQDDCGDSPEEGEGEDEEEGAEPEAAAEGEEEEGAEPEAAAEGEEEEGAEPEAAAEGEEEEGAEPEAAADGAADDEHAVEGTGTGTIRAHGGPASAPRLSADAASTAKARLRLSAQASSASAASRASKRLTFSAPPKCTLSRPRLAPRANFSHSAQRVRQILRDNAALVKRLGAIAFKQPEHELSQQQHDQFMANVAASSEKRREQEARAVERSNLAIYKRLQEVKPSRDVARASLDRDFAKHERMLATLAALRRRSRATSQPGASGGGRNSTQPGGGQRDSQSPSQRASVSAAAAGQRGAA